MDASFARTSVSTDLSNESIHLLPGAVIVTSKNAASSSTISEGPALSPDAEQLHQWCSMLQREFPSFRIVDKRSSLLSRCIDRFLKLTTFGGQDRFLTEYHTVIGDTLYVPDSWQQLTPLQRLILLRHERVHLLQRRRYGMVLMAFLYLVPFFPLGLAYGRARLEWEAYRETLRATAELLGLEAVHSRQLREQIVGRFTGPDYGWMWPFRRTVEKWYDQAIREIEDPASANRPANVAKF